MDNQQINNQQINFTVKEVVIISVDGETIHFYTSGLTRTFPIYSDEEQPTFTVKVKRSTGEKWMEDNFPHLSYTVIDRSGKRFVKKD